MKSLLTSFQIVDLGSYEKLGVHLKCSILKLFSRRMTSIGEQCGVTGGWARVSVSSTGSEGGRGSVMNTDTSQLQTFGAGGHTLTADRHTH